MGKNKILTIVIVLFLIATGWMVVQMMGSKDVLVSPVNRPTPQPSSSSYNPPKEIKYDSSTDLKQELESVNPQVNDSDF